MTSIKLKVTGAHAQAEVTGKLTSGMVGIPITIEYDEAWDGLTKNLICRCAPAGSSNGESRAILNVGAAATVAHEVMQANTILYLGIEGFSNDGKLVIPTVWAMCASIEPGANTCEDPTTDPELSVWNQLQTELEQIKSIGVGLYYTPFVTQPAGDTLKFEFIPSVSGALVPQPVVVELPVGEDGFQHLNLTVETITVGEDSGGPVAVTGLSLDLTSYNAKTGGGFYINPIVAPANATNRSVIWQSSKPAVATVNAMGYVECIAAGDAVITCTTVDGGFTATCAVSVAAAESGGGDSGGDTGGESTGQKIRFSALELTPGGIKADGTAHDLGGTYYVTAPYSEGMYIRTLYGSWNKNTYPAILVNTNSVYSIPDYNSPVKDENGVQTENIGGKLPNHVDATLTGYADGSSVIVGMLIGSADAAEMDSCNWLYYIPGGEN